MHTCDPLMHTGVILLNAYTCDSAKCIHMGFCQMHTCVILLNAYMCDPVKCIPL